MEQSQRKGDLNLASQIQYGKLPDLQKKLAGAEKALREKPAGNRLLSEEVTDEDIAQVVAAWTHIPVSRMLEGEREKLLKMEERLRERVIDAMTTNETSWFRDVGIFDLLKKNILPELSKNRTLPLNLWSAACSSGQEPYSISITVQEFLSSGPGLGRPGGEVQILATDISPSMLSQAAEGRYDQAALARGLSEERKQRFFIPRSTQWEVRPEIKRRVRFKEMNLLKPYQSLGRFDIIFCRNVLIYFSQDMKRDMLARATALLNPGGYLFLGSAESLASHSESFEMLRFPEGIVYRLKNKPDSRHGG